MKRDPFFMRPEGEACVSVGIMLVILLAVFALLGPIAFGAEPAQSLIGVNTDFVSPYQTSFPTIDAMKTSGPLKGSTFQVWGVQPGTAGDYTLSYDGNADVSVSGAALQKNADGSLRIRSNGGELRLTFTGGTFSNVRLIRPSYTAAQADAQVFTDEYIASKAPFGAVRLMDWLGTNNSPVVTWDDRCKPTDQTWTKKGGPIEPWLAFAVKYRKGLLINIQHAADDDHIRQLAKLCKATIGDAPVPLYLEYSNEVANGQFVQCRYVQLKGGPRWQGERTLFIIDAFRAEFGKNDPRVRPVLSGLLANIGFTRQAVAAMGPRARELYGVCVTNYFASNDARPGMSAQQIADATYAAALRFGTAASSSTNGVLQYKALADGISAKLIAYEGGVDLGQGKGTFFQAKADAQRLQRTGDAITLMVDKWMTLTGGGEYFYYKDFSLYNDSGVWGLSDMAGQLDGPKFKAAKQAAAKYGGTTIPPPPVVTPPPTTKPTEPPPTTRPTDPPPVVAGTLEQAIRRANGPVTYEQANGFVRVRIPQPSPIPDATFELRGNAAVAK